MPSYHLLLLFLFLTFFSFSATAKKHAPPRLTSTSSALEFAARYAAAASISASNVSAALQLTPARCRIGPVQDCVVLVDHSAKQLGRVSDVLGRIEPGTAQESQVNDASTWTSAALTDLRTCHDAAQSMPMGPCTRARGTLVRRLEEALRHTSNALYFISRISARP
ncbi:hypothetical protein J5N97_009340 [Dioscorea zingiberensis]|uniref:Pectinesterase inhibitor domain-containing protein n=1 Tax=Dioscorea zingiberensis TaxID=325984 RepID=A0A9D5CZ94_9LILI|nr:hypothetical protein J5N97_009340 [Dioscorea zingiberensis]